MAALILVLVLLSGCSLRSLAVNALANSLAASGDVFASDEDPELVRDAMPFALKTMESLLAENPGHRGLLLATCRAFTGYAYAFVDSEAALLEYDDYAGATRGRGRALKLYLRARDYCLRSLDQVLPGIHDRLESDPEAALVGVSGSEVDILYWTAASWGSAISLAKDRPEIVVDLPAVRALGERVLEFDESYDRGAGHELMLILEALPATMGGSEERARHHFERAVELSTGHKAGLFVSLAENVSVANQDAGEFRGLLQRALSVDLDAEPSLRLTNIVAQRRAEFLLRHLPDLFFEFEDLEGTS